MSPTHHLPCTTPAGVSQVPEGNKSNYLPTIHMLAQADQAAAAAAAATSALTAAANEVAAHERTLQSARAAANERLQVRLDGVPLHGVESLFS